MHASPAWQIRRAQARDTDGIVRLMHQLSPASDPQALAARFRRTLFGRSHTCLVAAAGGPIDDDAHPSPLLGLLCAERRLLLQTGDRFEITALVVDAQARRMGVGRALIAAIERTARKRGLASVVVRSHVERDSSHPFYLQLGFALQKTQHVYTRTLTP